jgi:eukaryotic-like serine/threonine-protein kinase
VTLEGSSFDGYQLLQPLGHGGAGEVYLAEAPARGPVVGWVAIKVFRDAAGHPALPELMRQARVAATLEHPHILQCYANAAEGDDVGIVMTLAQGGSLGDMVGDAASDVALPMRPESVARIISQVAHTLADVQPHGLIHGDLKPSNLFVRSAPDGSPVVALSDFGHAFLTHAAVSWLRDHRTDSPPEWVVEQMTWAAPEQILGKSSSSSDQYSLAAIAYFLLTGVRPISSEAQSVLNGRPPKSIMPPSRLNPALDDETDAMLFHALSPVPEQRFADVVDFADALNAVLVTRDLSGNTSYARASASRQVADSLRKAGSSVATRPRPFPGRLSLPTSSRRVMSTAALVQEDDQPRVDPATRMRRRLTRYTSVALLLAVLALMVSTLVFNVGPLRLPVHLDLSRLVNANNGGSPRATATVESSAQAQAVSRLRTALAGKAAYSDALTGAPASWPVSGKTIFFGPDHRLHLHNTAKTPLFANMPASVTMPQAAYVAQVDVAQVSGATSDHAGMRFLISKSDKGETYYSYLVTADGRFDLWLQQPETGMVFLTSGYVASLKSGMGQVNTLAVLMDPTANTLSLYANGAFIYQSPIGHGVSLSGRLGLVTPDANVEATFANVAIYPA